MDDQETRDAVMLACTRRSASLVEISCGFEPGEFEAATDDALGSLAGTAFR